MTRPFVINLCTLTAPITVPQPRASRLNRYSFFLSRDWVNGQRQYRLHMGYFTSTAEAEKWLTTLKRVYPDAYIGVAPEAQPDLMGDTERLRILNIGQVGGAGNSTPGVGNSHDGGNANAPLHGQQAPRGLPASRELFVRDTGKGPARRNRPSLEDTLDELRTSEFDMGADDDSNSTGVRHLRIDVLRESAGAQSPPRPGSRARR